MCADYLVASSDLDEALTRASKFMIWDSSWDHVNVQKLFSMCMHFIPLDQGPGLLRVPGMWTELFVLALRLPEALLWLATVALPAEKPPTQSWFIHVDACSRPLPIELACHQVAGTLTRYKLAGGTITSFRHAHGRPHMSQRCANPHSPLCANMCQQSHRWQQIQQLGAKRGHICSLAFCKYNMIHHVLLVALKSDINKNSKRNWIWFKIPEDCTALEATVVALLTLLDLLILLKLPLLHSVAQPHIATARKLHKRRKKQILLSTCTLSTRQQYTQYTWSHSFSLFPCLPTSFYLFLPLLISFYLFLNLSNSYFLVVTCHLETHWTRPATSNWPCSCFGLAKAPAASDERLEKTSLHDFQCLHDTNLLLCSALGQEIAHCKIIASLHHSSIH